MHPHTAPVVELVEHFRKSGVVVPWAASASCRDGGGGRKGMEWRGVSLCALRPSRCAGFGGLLPSVPYPARLCICRCNAVAIQL
jgi:hypothetical protein